MHQLEHCFNTDLERGRRTEEVTPATSSLLCSQSYNSCISCIRWLHSLQHLTPTHLHNTYDSSKCARILCCLFINTYIVTLITDVSTLDGGLCTCAAAAMLAMVLRWFIWLIAIVTDAGGRLTGINGWGIIIKGSSNPGGQETKREKKKKRK